jgi:predicted DNA-binding protein with PD1-like motif
LYVGIDWKKQYVVIFYHGDKAFSGLLEFAEKHHVTISALFGAVYGAMLRCFDPQRKMYKRISRTN